jgi:hypothetical protein
MYTAELLDHKCLNRTLHKEAEICHAVNIHPVLLNIKFNDSFFTKCFSDFSSIPACCKLFIRFHHHQ